MNPIRSESPKPQQSSFPLAIVGMGCRFPGGADDVESFWKLVAEGRNGICEVPADRWNRDRFYHPDSAVPGAMISKWGGFIENVDRFDAHFWGITPREAMRMDPQQRWLLEVAWEAIEDAGIPPERVRGSNAGVFVGIAANDYAGLQMPNFAGTDVHTNSGCTLSIASNRISYLLDLRGPSVSVDTACSSALVAVWSACRSIWDGCCDSALAGGVNALITPHATIGFSKASMLSPSGQCFAFDARANGYVRGEGAGMVYIKRLDRAVADGDRVYAIIRAAASNQDGHTSSMTVPGVEGQAALLRQAYLQAGIPPSRVVYMEAHGTGTPVGDPIEATALGRVLGEGREPDQPCLMGSVKTNIGHLEAGSGVAGLIKAALVLHKDMVPPNRDFEKPNPYIPFRTLRLEVVKELRPLPHQNGYPPVTAVNSFGFGGTNAHVVLEQAPPAAKHPEVQRRAPRPYVLPISARDDVALRKYVESYRALLAGTTASLADICYSAGERKDHHGHRLVVVGDDAAQMRKRLGAWLRGTSAVEGVIAGRSVAKPSAPVFVFTGQGAQWWAMGRELLLREPAFRKAVDAIDRLLRKLSGWSLIEEMTREEKDSNIDRTDIAQPAIFALQVGLSELWKSWGIHPAKVVGHSVGEVAAAYCAGIYSLEDAVKVIYHRSRLQNTTGGHGRMLAAGISAAEARSIIGDAADRVHVAVINSSNLITLAGDTEPLEKIAKQLEESGKFNRWLRIHYAFHTHQMDPIKDELLEVLGDIRPRPASVPFISAVTGGALDGERLDATYWWRNVRQPVLFGTAIANLVRGKVDTFLEIGPHPALAGSISDCLKDRGQAGAVFCSLRRGADDSQELLTNLAGLHIRGVPLDWATVNQSAKNFVRLPRYPWNRESYWLESEESQRTRLASSAHPLLGLRLSAPQPTWQFELHPRRFPYLNDHRFWDSIVLPGACYGEIGIALARLLFPDDPHAVEDLEMKKALFITEDQPPTVQVVFDPETKTYSVYSRSGDQATWDLNAQGRLTRFVRVDHAPVDLEQLRKPLTDHLDNAKYYEDMAAAGYQFGPNFKQLQNVWRVYGEALTEIVPPDAIRETYADYHFQPAVLDACFHIFKGLKPAPDTRPEENFYLPHSIKRIYLYTDKPPARCWAHGRLLLDDGKSLVADILVFDDEGRRVAEILRFRGDKAEQKRSADTVENCYYQFHWETRRLRGSRIEGSCAFPNSTEFVGAARADVSALYKQHDIESYHQRFAPRVDALVCQNVQNAWLQLGWSPAAGERINAKELMNRLGIVDAHHRLACAHLRDLAKHGFLRAAGDDDWEVVRTLQHADTSAGWAALATLYPQFSAEVVLHQQTGPSLAGVLTGEIDPLELLFPGGSAANLERFYVEAGDFPAITLMVKSAIGRASATLPRRRVLRVLEIGGGTGGLTKALLPVLPADRAEYLFTDIGPAFVSAAKKRFAEYPFVEYRTFDIEQDPKAQGLEPGSFDMIVGSLVLHATADLKQVLSNLRSCLADGGMLLFLEVFPRRHAWDNIFGLLGGWWRFTDTDLRRHSPLLARGQWLELLTESGFRDPGSFGTSPDETESEQGFVFAYADPQAKKQTQDTPEASRASGTYVLLADNGGVGDALSDRLCASGDRVVQVRVGTAYRRDSDTEFVVDADSEADLCRVFAELDVPTNELAGVVSCWSLDHPRVDGMCLESLREAQRTGVLAALRLIHALTAAPPSRVWFVTRGVHSVGAGDMPTNLASAPLVGLLRVANNEYFPSRFALIDLDFPSHAEEIGDLYQEIKGADVELEVTYHADQRHVLRVGRTAADKLPVRTRSAVQPDGTVVPFRLQTSKPGVLTNLSLNESQRRTPGANDIEIRVRAGGINFRDVLKALAMHPGNPPDLLWFGDDVSGTVERVGANVRHLKPGDEVVGVVPYAFQAYVTADARMVFKKPKTMSFEEAATLPTVFLTAHYSINHLARMKKGESILIHAGTGGVGLAAIQIAQHLGLEIFATAGSDEKRQLLRGMGVPHVMSSRTLEFADQVMEITKGRGVDAVLNSLAGEFIPKSMSVLAPFGRFLEIGKIDIYKNTKIGLEPLKANISYFVIDLTGHFQHRQEDIASMFHELEERFETGAYRPILHTDFPITKAVDAFRYMAQGKHVGKNVLSLNVPEIQIGPCTDTGHTFRANATYLITGGAGGFGLELAKWMSKHGARHLALLSRSGPRDDAARADIDQLRAKGINVLDGRGDVTKLADVTAIVDQIRQEMPPLRGVVHAAMVLDDDFLAALDENRFLTALEPKMAGAWNLHIATQETTLEHFVLFSSLSSVVGVPKQSNYNAGNYFIEALGRYRHASGLPALAINWGALLGAGFVERNKKTADFLDKIGVKAFNMGEALQVFSQMMLVDPVQIAAARIEWRALSKTCPNIAQAPTYAALMRESSDTERGGSLIARLQGASADCRLTLVEDFIVAQVAGVFGVTEEKVDRDTPLTNLGLDSLMAVELTNRMEREVGTSIPMGSLLGGPSIKVLSQTILRLATQNFTTTQTGEAAQTGSVDLAPLERVIPAHNEFPLSHGQQALWRLCSQDAGGPAFNLTFSAKLRPGVQVESMRLAFAALFERHPMLTATFSQVSGEPVQRLHKNVETPFREHDVRDIGADQLRQRLVNLANRPFNLERGHLIRLDLFRTRDDAHIALLSVHKLIADSSSAIVLIHDLFENYAALTAGLRPNSNPTAFSFEDFATWERKQLEGPAAKSLADFWKRQLKDAPIDLDLAIDHPRGEVRTFRGDAHGFRLDDELAQRVLVFSAEQNIPLATMLLAGFQLTLHRWCHQDDLLVGCPLSGRSHAELAGLVGCFANTLPLRSRVDDDPTFVEFLSRTGRNLSSAKDHQHYPLPRLLTDLNVPEDAKRPPLIQAVFSSEGLADADEQGTAVFLLGQRGHKFHQAGRSTESIDLPLRRAPYELTLAVEEAGGIVYGSWQYNRDLFEPATIARLNELYARTLQELTRDPSRHVSDYLRDGAPPTNGFARLKAAGQARARFVGGESADLAAEAKLDPSISPPAGVSTSLSMNRVLLTGATGYLGAFLLDELLRETDAEVHCLVRAKSAQQGFDRIAENLRNYGLEPAALRSRTVPIVGDLEKPLLGLTEDDFNRLADEIDLIIHSGALVNLISPYERLKGTNVNGTREVLRLACRTRPKPVHYVSTFGVLAASDRHALSVATEGEPLPPYEKLPVGYQRSKWVCETMLQQAQARGLPVSIYRPGNIAGHSRTGVCNDQDFLHTLVLACSRIRAVPQIELEADATPVDYVAQAIVSLSRRPECVGNTYHLVNPQPLRLPRLVDWMQRIGIDVDLVPYANWYKQLVALVDGAPDEIVAPLMQLLGPIDPRGEAPRNWHPRYDCQNAVSNLAPCGISCPPVDDQLLNTYLSYMLRSGRVELQENERGKLQVSIPTSREP